MLTQEQINHFQTFGFLTFRQLFSQDELKTINTEFEAAMTEAFRDDPFDGTRRHWLITMGPDTPFLASLLEDPAILRCSGTTLRRRCLRYCFRH